MNIRVTAAALAAVFLATGCASIVGGTSQDVSVQARAADGSSIDARCQLSNNRGQWEVQAPGTVRVRRSSGDLRVACRQQQGATGETSAAASVRGMVFGNILFGGLIGIVIDFSNKAAFAYPDGVLVNMRGEVVARNPLVNQPAAVAQPSATVTAPVAAQSTERRGERAGTWSFEVEKLAKQRGCEGSGAWLVSEADGVGTYRVDCRNDKPLLVVCSAGQCRPAV
ncbi:hypothetical protein [Chitinimonas lacunae]|uniref:Lipoprotein n=1 Tax=Chitinimonas lacunae TaxID=1963018 RepID=A0ABV8MP22_9NEIS